MGSVPPPLAAFIEDVETLISTESSPQSVALGVQARLPTLLREPCWLTSEDREPDPVRYRTHILAVAPSRRFSLLSLVWLPGQATAIHDHITWCVVGVLQGREHEERYNLRQNANGDRWLVPIDAAELQAGQCSILVPPEENIHQVRNACDEVAISLHVYGADLEVWGSSINECFDDLPTHVGDFSGTAIAWRQSRMLKPTEPR
jgi:3-mercaptopropionate dioxygenase